MRNSFQGFAAIVGTCVLGLASPSNAADDFSYIAGTYALNVDDCKAAAAGKPFSKELVEVLSQEVMTREGITSPREVHCKFRSSAAAEKGWTVKADCEEMGEGSPADLAVTANPDGSLAVVSEDVWGPEPQVFLPCPK